ncbi:MAG: TonB family protein [Dysgonamonadaceae bacterium]|jgi:TonB family protein|nr:TonB family protein [Dysgonamonadaceae bacterium]
MKVTKEQISGFTGSAICCLIVVLILSFLFLQTEINTQEEGTLVNFGTVDWAEGTVEPKPETDSGQVPREENIPDPVKTPPVITQNTEQTAAVDVPEKKTPERDKQPTEQERREAADIARKEAINRQMSGAFGAGETAKGNEGTASAGAGNQGSTQGNAPVGSYAGTGGIGDFDLSGRSLRGGGLQRPSYEVQEEGTIAVEITVDSKGNVIHAEIRLRGTNIENANMRKAALDAARKTTFNAIRETQNQVGTITYRYSLK